MVETTQPHDWDPSTDPDQLRARIRCLLASPELVGEIARDLNNQRYDARPEPRVLERPPEALAQLARLAMHAPVLRMHNRSA